MNELLETEKAYIAGFFDGEGYVGILKHIRGGAHKTPIYSMYVVLSQKGEVPLFELRDLVDVGSIHEMVTYPGQYNWQIRARDAVDFLNMVLPYLKVKKEQALIAIEFQSKQGHKNSKGKGWIVPPEMVAEKEAYYQKLKDLKGTSSKGRGRPRKNF